MENAPELEEDISFCARESVLDVVPRLVAMRDGAAEIVALAPRRITRLVETAAWRGGLHSTR